MILAGAFIETTRPLAMTYADFVKICITHTHTHKGFDTVSLLEIHIVL